MYLDVNKILLTFRLQTEFFLLKSKNIKQMNTGINVAKRANEMMDHKTEIHVADGANLSNQTDAVKAWTSNQSKNSSYRPSSLTKIDQSSDLGKGENVLNLIQRRFSN